MTFFSYNPQSVDLPNGTATSEVSTLSLHDALPISGVGVDWISPDGKNAVGNGLNLSSGTNLNGTWTGTIGRAHVGNPVTLAISILSAAEKGSNLKSYYQSDL